MVFPELEPGLARVIRRMTPLMWWLSIDNGLRAVTEFGGFAAIRASGWMHLCQSYYALEYLARQGIQGLPLFDYTAPEHASAAAEAGRAARQDRILYPMRGRWFTDWLKRWAPDLPWQEISGFTPEQVQSLFLTSKLYVDFGRHPGKDRMPREAAALGCCIITGQRGAAGNWFDIPIPISYKFRNSRMNVPRIRVRFAARWPGLTAAPRTSTPTAASSAARTRSSWPRSPASSAAAWWRPPYRLSGSPPTASARRAAWRG